MTEQPAEPVYAPSVVIEVLDRLSKMLADARSVPFTASVAVNQAECLELIENAREALPEDVKNADRIVADASVVLDRADLEAEQTITEAKQKVSEANSEAEKISQQADEYAAKTRSQAAADAAAAAEEAAKQREEQAAQARHQADQIIAQSKQEGKKIILQARQQAAELVSQESVYREARTRADTLIQETTAKLNQRRVEANRYVAAQLQQLETLSAKIHNEARSGREKVENEQ